MNLIPRITVRSTESLFEFFLNSSQLKPDQALELLEDMAADSKNYLWAFKRDGDDITIYHYPGQPFKAEVRDGYIVVPHGQSHTILGWLPSNISASLMGVAKDVSVRLESSPEDPKAVNISLAQFLT
jgi:hypothetical protein